MAKRSENNQPMVRVHRPLAEMTVARLKFIEQTAGRAGVRGVVFRTPPQLAVQLVAARELLEVFDHHLHRRPDAAEMGELGDMLLNRLPSSSDKTQRYGWGPFRAFRVNGTLFGLSLFEIPRPLIQERDAARRLIGQHYHIPRQGRPWRVPELMRPALATGRMEPILHLAQVLARHADQELLPPKAVFGPVSVDDVIV